MVGLGLLYVGVSLVGIVLSFLYRFAMYAQHPFGVRFFAPFVFGVVLAGAVFGLKRFFKVTWGVAALGVVAFAFLGIYFMVWNGFPLRGAFIFPPIGDWEVPEMVPRLVAYGEAAVVTLPALFYAVRSSGVYLPGDNRWARVRLLDYGFRPFTDRELEQLSVGNTALFERKPIDLTGLNSIHAVGLCYANKTLTRYLAVFNAAWNRQGYIERGRLLLLAPLQTVEAVEDLQARLYELHRESELP